jgi:hypothetical protein
LDALGFDAEGEPKVKEEQKPWNHLLREFKITLRRGAYFFLKREGSVWPLA